VVEYREKVLNHQPLATRTSYNEAIEDFERHCAPNQMSGITTLTIDQFVSKRSKDAGRGGPATRSERVSLTLPKTLHQSQSPGRVAHIGAKPGHIESEAVQSC